MARESYWPAGSKTAQDQEKRALATEHDRQVRNRSVANDIRLDLPVSVARPDGEEYPARQRLRSHDKRYEIQKPYIQGPPNKTVKDVYQLEHINKIGTGEDKNKQTVWDSRDCLERTVTQPSSSSSSRSGGSKSTSKSSSSHWGLSWSRLNNKSPPSQGRGSRGQQRHASNPSNSVRNASSSCETARGGGGTTGNGGLLVNPSLQSSFMSLSSSTLGSIPNSSLIGFHGAATVAGDNSAFPNHNQSSFSSHQSTPNTTSCKQQQQHHQHHHQPVVFPGGGGGGSGTLPPGEITSSPSIAERLSEKVQQCTNVIVGNHTRTSPNNNSSNSTTTTTPTQQSTSSVLSRLIDPDSKLFSRNNSKDSKRSNNNNNHGKNGKSHRTDQSSSASSSPGGSSSSLVESGAQASLTIFPSHPQQTLHHEQLQQHSYFNQSRNSQHSQPDTIPHHHSNQQQQQQEQVVPMDLPTMLETSPSDGGGVTLSSSTSTTTNPFLGVDSEGDEVMLIKRSNKNVVMPLLTSCTPNNNNPSCSLSGGSRRSSGRSGPRSFDAYCGADAGAIEKSCSDSKARDVLAGINTDPSSEFHVPSPIQPQEKGSLPSPISVSVLSDCENGNKCSSSRDKDSTDESSGKVPPVAATVQSLTSQQHCGASDTNTLKLSQSSFPYSTRMVGGDDANSVLVVQDEEMKGLGEERHQQQLHHQHYHHHQPPSIINHPHSPSSSLISSSVSFSQNVQQMSSSVPSNHSLLPSFNFNNNAAALLPRDNLPALQDHPPPPLLSSSSSSSSSSPHAAIATASFVAAESEMLSERCSRKEKKRNEFTENGTFSSSGCSTDPNYSTFANDKITDNNNCCTLPPPTPSPHHPFSSSSSSREHKSHLQSRNDDSRGIVSDNNNFNTNCSSSSHHHREFIAADHDDEQMISESTTSCATTVITNANNDKGDGFEFGESMTCEKPTSLRETAHHCELSVIASKNDTTTTSTFDQYCNVAAASTAELITSTTSLHSSPSTNDNSPVSTVLSTTSLSALSSTSSNNVPSMSSSSSSSMASHNHHQNQQLQQQEHHHHHHHQNVVVDDKFDYDMQNQ